MNSVVQDIRYGARMLRAHRGFTIVAVLTLGLGIGANSAIFSVVNSVLLRPLPYNDSGRLVEIWETNPIKGWTDAPVASANLLDWQARNDVFEDIGAYIPSLQNFSLMSGDSPERLQGVIVTPNLFSVLDAAPLLGRSFLPDEQEDGKRDVIILSYALWQRSFGGNPGIVGQAIKISGANRTVVGIMPKGFQFPTRGSELWVPLGISRARMATIRRPHFLNAVARLKPGVTVAQAASEMTVIASALEEQYPETNVKMGVGLGPLQKWIIGDTSLPLLVFLAAVGFVLLIACANVANLMLARGISRAREIGLRMALGADRSRLVRQLLTEGMLLSILGGGLGLFLSIWSLPLLLRLSPGTIPRLDEVRLDARAIGFTLALSLLTTLVFGFLPALEGTRLDLVTSIKDSGRGSTTGARGRSFQSILIVAEVALSLVVVTASGLLLRSFSRLAGVSPGFSPDKLLTLQLSLPGSKYPNGQQAVDFYNELEAHLRNLPGVASAGSITTLPLNGTSFTSDFTIENRPPEEYGKEVRHNTVTPDYFRTVGISLERGRFFTLADGSKTTPVIIINHTLEQQYFAGEDPIGKRLKFSKPQVADNDWFTIAGVVGDEKQDGLATAARPEIYQPIAQNPVSEIAMVVRTLGDPRTTLSGIRERIRSMDPELPPFNIQTMDDVLYRSLARDRFTTVLLLIFGGVALVLAAIGVYGIISYGVTQRVQEVGVRMALGAQTGDVLRLIVGQGLKLVLVGIALGAVAAFATTRLISDLLYQVSATDPLTFGATSLLIMGIALLACYVPARRASSTDPIEAIRIE